MNLTRYYLLIIFLINHSLYSDEQKGICITWVEGDGLSIQDCKGSTLKECSLNKKKIKNKDTAFQSYKGKLFLSESDGHIFEFLNESVSTCEERFIKNARDYEGTMSANWGYITFSEHLKKGDKAFIYGEKVNLRENPGVNAKKIMVLENGTEIRIVEKGNKRDKVKSSNDAYWFKINIKDKTGWVYGAFLHPDPKSKEAFVSE